jgi:hypothetical protein
MFCTTEVEERISLWGPYAKPGVQEAIFDFVNDRSAALKGSKLLLYSRNCGRINFIFSDLQTLRGEN